jgi:hypothetical protein
VGAGVGVPGGGVGPQAPEIWKVSIPM